MELVERMRRDPDWAALRQPLPPAESRPILRSWLERGFTAAILDHWGIRWDPQVNAMAIPVCDAAGASAGDIWRAPEGVEPKYRYAQGFRRREILFGVWRLPAVSVEIVLVEGPLDAVWGQEAGLPTCGLLGASLSEEQIALLRQRGARRITLCFDNDPTGERATKTAAVELRKAGLWVFRARLPSRYKDIQEVPLAAAKSLVESRRQLAANGHGVVALRYQRWLRGKERIR